MQARVELLHQLWEDCGEDTAVMSPSELSSGSQGPSLRTMEALLEGVRAGQQVLGFQKLELVMASGSATC